MSNTIRNKIETYIDFLKPIKGILLFLSLFFLFEFFWKLCVDVGETKDQLIFLGWNLTPYTQPICEFDAKIVYFVIHDLFGYKNYNINGSLVYFDNGLKMDIIWSCTSIKQYLLFVFIMICYYGPRKQKYIFIPSSLLILSFINIIRLVISSLLLKNGLPDWFIPFNEILNGVQWDGSSKTYWIFYRDWFHFYHDGFFKWVYYDGIMFLIWLFWQEKYNLPYQKAKEIE